MTENIPVKILIVDDREENLFAMEALNCGMDDYITKPFKPNELYFIIEKLTRLNTGNHPL